MVSAKERWEGRIKPVCLIAAVIREEESEWGCAEHGDGHSPHHLVIDEPWVDSPVEG